jgi:hypothetical protein
MLYPVVAPSKPSRDRNRSSIRHWPITRLRYSHGCSATERSHTTTHSSVCPRWPSRSLSGLTCLHRSVECAVNSGRMDEAIHDSYQRELRTKCGPEARRENAGHLRTDYLRLRLTSSYGRRVGGQFKRRDRGGGTGFQTELRVFWAGTISLIITPGHDRDADRTVASYSRKERGVRPVAARNAFVK